MTLNPTRVDVQTAYERCEAITWEQARNFAYGIRLLPRAKRQRLSAVYAYARRIDDIGDGDLPAPEKLHRLEECDRELAWLAEDPTGAGGSDDPVLVALGDATRHGLSLGPFGELVDGCRDDVAGRVYLREQETYDYCRKVAGSVGRLSLSVFGVADEEEGAPLANALGIGLQLTNILRDVVEDARAGRVYLPGEHLQRFGCRFELGPDGGLSDDPRAVRSLVLFEVGLARSWYAQGLRLLPLLDRRSRACCAALAGIYLQLLDRIEAEPERILRGRTSVPTRSKLAVAGRALALGTP